MNTVALRRPRSAGREPGHEAGLGRVRMNDVRAPDESEQAPEVHGVRRPRLLPGPERMHRHTGPLARARATARTPAGRRGRPSSARDRARGRGRSRAASRPRPADTGSRAGAEGPTKKRGLSFDCLSACRPRFHEPHRDSLRTVAPQARGARSDGARDRVRGRRPGADHAAVPVDVDARARTAEARQRPALLPDDRLDHAHLRGGRRVGDDARRGEGPKRRAARDHLGSHVRAVSDLQDRRAVDRREPRAELGPVGHRRPQ